LTPFVFHKQSNPIIEAAKDAGVAWALVDPNEPSGSVRDETRGQVRAAPRAASSRIE
jgi:hypothetical protein